MRRIFPPSEPGAVSAPWSWALFLFGIELAISAAGVGLAWALGIDSKSWIGMASPLAGAVAFGFLSERRQPDALAPRMKRQLAGRMAAVTVLATVFSFIGISFQLPQDGPGPLPLLLFGALVTALAATTSWFFHLWGFGLGERLARRCKRIA